MVGGTGFGPVSRAASNEAPALRTASEEYTMQIDYDYLKQLLEAFVAACPWRIVILR